MKNIYNFLFGGVKPVNIVSPKVISKKVDDIRVPLGKYDYIGPVYNATKKDKYFTGKTEGKQWRIVVDKKGRVYKLETKLNLHNVKRR